MHDGPCRWNFDPRRGPQSKGKAVPHPWTFLSPTTGSRQPTGYFYFIRNKLTVLRAHTYVPTRHLKILFCPSNIFCFSISVVCPSQPRFRLGRHQKGSEKGQRRTARTYVEVSILHLSSHADTSTGVFSSHLLRTRNFFLHVQRLMAKSRNGVST